MTKKKVAESPIKKLSEVEPVTFITSGIKEIDDLVGGYPRGRMTQIYGLASVGKTTMMIKCLAKISQDHKVLFCDVENSINLERVKELGANTDQISFTNISLLEDVTELIRENLNNYDMIILDSIAMLTPRAEYTGEMGQANVGVKPRLLGQWLRMITEDLNKSKCCLVLVNQMRRTMEMYAAKYVLPGGLQLKFSSSLMLKLSSTKSRDVLIKEGEALGHWVNVEVEKNKFGPPYLSTRFFIKY